MARQPPANGVIPVAMLQKNAPPPAPRGPKAASPRLKLVLRRLPPGLNEQEFLNILGDDWKVGTGKIDYLDFKKGKVSRDAAKPSRPARAYIRVTSQVHAAVLGDYVRQQTWQDVAKSYQDSALVGPPTLEYSPYHRIPANKSKQDNRQGTIDQDAEFKSFLEALTNPITKPVSSEDDDKKTEKVKTTPLIESLREKKANKEKPQAKTSGKHGRGEPKDDTLDKTEKKILSKSAAKEAVASASSDKSRRPTKAEKSAAAKEAVKALNKEASSSKEAVASSSSEKVTSERKRTNASLAKSMLQRDLGIGPAASRRRGSKREAPTTTQDSTSSSVDTTNGKQKAASSPSNVPSPSSASDKPAATPAKKERLSRSDRRAFKATLGDKSNSKHQEQAKPTVTPAPTILKKPQNAQLPTAPKAPSTTRVPPTEPAASRPTTTKTDPPTTNRSLTVASSSTSNIAVAPAPSGRQAFLKHANPSQGITESLIEEALRVFGAIDKVEIDKRKGFAYVDFSDSGGLQKAIAGSPIKVAQGAVHVLERKEKVARAPPNGPTRGRGGFSGRSRGGRGGSRGGTGTATTTTAAGATPAAVGSNPAT